MNFRSEDDSHETEYIFVITRKRLGVSEYTMVEFDNFDGEFDVDEAELELGFSMTKGWEMLSHVDGILDGEDFINCCIDIDEMITFTN
jgi:hypothetical protein